MSNIMSRYSNNYVNARRAINMAIPGELYNQFTEYCRDHSTNVEGMIHHMITETVKSYAAQQAMKDSYMAPVFQPTPAVPAPADQGQPGQA